MIRPHQACLLALFLMFGAVAAAQDVSATGGSGGLTPPDIRSYGDDREVKVEEELASLRTNNEGLAGSVAPHPVSFDTAIAQARALAQKAVTPAALALTLKRLPNNDPATLRLLAVREHMQRRPEATFALLVAAYERTPDSPDSLADLAGMLAGFGHANEALAIIDELARRNAVPSPPFGISGADALAYMRGYCLVRLGNVAAAKPLLRGVAARQPQLAEAARLLAAVSDDPAEQRKYLLQSVWRHRPPLMSSSEPDLDQHEPDPLKDAPEVCADLRAILDFSRAKPGVLPSIHYAKSVPEANDLAVKLEDLKSQASEKFGAILAQRKDPPGYRHTEDDVQETWPHRMAGIMSRLDYRDRTLRDLERTRRKIKEERIARLTKIGTETRKAAEDAQDEYSQTQAAKHLNPSFEQISEKARPFLDQALDRARGEVQREEKAERDRFAEWHRVASAVANQVRDPAWHEFMRLSIEAERWKTYEQLLHLAQIHAMMGEHPGITRGEGEVPMTPTAQEVEKCNGNAPLQFSTGSLPGGDKLPFQVGASLGCEGMKLEVDVGTEVPGVSVNGEIAFDNRGDFTAFVGPKAEVSVGHQAVAAASLSAKAGMYVTGNKNGITDAGVKMVASGSANVGSHSASQTFVESSASFYPSPLPASNSGIEGLQNFAGGS